ncbi:MAG TPA: DinB family protein [Candidatus Acidoferrum sp.]|nr:DinB family protein [Candidatus Acidoferrum sp.]
MLPAAPRRIAELTASLSSVQLQTAPGFGGWSANEVLAHLRACADVWGGCIMKILAENRPTLKAVNPRTWINQTDYLDQSFQPSLQAFRRQRARLIAVLQPLGPEAWKRTAAVTGAGKPLTRTVLFYADWLVRHERPHIRQIERIVSGGMTMPSSSFGEARHRSGSVA